jgi:hypothetical protein
LRAQVLGPDDIRVHALADLGGGAHARGGDGARGDTVILAENDSNESEMTV